MFTFEGQKIPDDFMVDGYDRKVTNAEMGKSPKQVVFSIDYMSRKTKREAQDAAMLKRLQHTGSQNGAA